MAVTFPRYFAKGDFGMDTGTVTLKSGNYVEVGSKKVGARQEIAFGTGDTVDVDTRKKAQIKLYTASGQYTNGTLRLVVADANLINQPPVQEDLLSNWSDGVEVEEKSTAAGEDGFLKVFVNGNEDTTLDFTNSSTQVDIPVVVTNLGVN